MNLVPPKRAVDSYYDFSTPTGGKVSKVIGVFGANGSGKTSLIHPLVYMAHFVSGSFGPQNIDNSPYPHAHFSAKDKSASFEIEFCLTHKDESGTFLYKLEVDKERVIFEELKYKTSTQYTSILKREYIEETGSYEISKVHKHISASPSKIMETPENVSAISYIRKVSKFNIKKAESIDEFDKIYLAHFFFKNIRSNLKDYGRASTVYTGRAATEVYQNRPEVFELAKDIMTKLDLGIVDIELRKAIIIENDEEKEEIVPFFIHEGEDRTYSLTYANQSTGTQTAYRLLASIGQSLSFGGILVLDEFDNDFHSSFSQEILNLFKNDEINTHCAQVLFSSHNVELFKELSNHHIYLTEKSEGISDSWRIDEIEGLKERDNIYKKYLSGALGALPDFG